mgnify:CR=1 FL=1|jgi:UDP-glucose 4-epimerase|tara:strand:- start:286 stop:1176 length:891 start_codon:yes stop_codon:yes gene_type:complete
MNILVIGGAGFLGSHLVDYLEKAKHRVTIYDKNYGHFKKKDKKKIILGDINNYNKLSRVIKNKDVVYNYAAISDIGETIFNPIQTTKNNILANVLILNLCVKFKIKKFIFASTIYVHSSQGSFYKVSKQSSELFIEEYYKKFGLNYSIIRFGSVFGPRASKKNGLSKIIHKALVEKKIFYSGTKKAVRKFIYVKDAARGGVEVLKKKYNNKNLLLTGNSSTKITDVLKKISLILKIKKKPTFSNSISEGHYNISPYSYIPKKDLKMKIKNTISLKDGIFELIKDIKKNEQKNNTRN